MVETNTFISDRWLKFMPIKEEVKKNGILKWFSISVEVIKNDSWDEVVLSKFVTISGSNFETLSLRWKQWLYTVKDKEVEVLGMSLLCSVYRMRSKGKSWKIPSKIWNEEKKYRLH